MTYELMFAIITPALICGAFADRMRFPPMLLFMACWHLVVYCPMAHATCNAASHVSPVAPSPSRPPHSSEAFYFGPDSRNCGSVLRHGCARVCSAFLGAS